MQSNTKRPPASISRRKRPANPLGPIARRLQKATGLKYCTALRLCRESADCPGDLQPLIDAGNSHLDAVYAVAAVRAVALMGGGR